MSKNGDKYLRRALLVCSICENAVIYCDHCGRAFRPGEAILCYEKEPDRYLHYCGPDCLIDDHPYIHNSNAVPEGPA